MTINNTTDIVRAYVVFIALGPSVPKNSINSEFITLCEWNMQGRSFILIVFYIFVNAHICTSALLKVGNTLSWTLSKRYLMHVRQNV